MTYLVAENIAHVLPNAAIVPLRVLAPVDAVHTAPGHDDGALLSELAGLVLLALSAAHVPDLRALDFFALAVVEDTGLPARRGFADLDFQMRRHAVVVLAQTLTLDVAHLGHHGFCLADLGPFGRAIVVRRRGGWLLVAYRWRRDGGVGVADWGRRNCGIAVY